MASGIILGLVAFLGLSRALLRLLYDVGPTDPATLLPVIAILIAVGTVAAYLPARRAASIDPALALRDG